MGAMIDYLGSMLIGGVVILMMISFNGNVIESSGLQTFKTGVQGNLTTVTDILENDFRKMGYRIPVLTDSAIVYADTTTLKFRGDINNDGTIDTVTYFIDTAGARLTTNPKDSVLFRQVNRGGATAMFVGMISFKMRYYNSSDSLIPGNRIFATSKIKSILVSMNMQSKDPYDTVYVGAYWERKIRPRNL
jgi:hypothetical protein